jgi:hypothetical protein
VTPARQVWTIVILVLLASIASRFTYGCTNPDQIAVMVAGVLAFEAPVSDAALPKAIALANAPGDPNDWDAVYELTEADARAVIGDVPPGLAFFLEAVSC